MRSRLGAGCVPFENVYDDAQRAEAYATLDFPGTYFLAFRDLPRIIGNHVAGSKALDFGCGAGRSTRFLKGLGFQATGIDISESMVRMAHKLDPTGRYEVVPDGDFRLLGAERFDLVFSAFAFDNIPGPSHRAQLLQSLRDLLTPHGRIILLGSAPEIYTHTNGPRSRPSSSRRTVQREAARPSAS